MSFLFFLVKHNALSTANQISEYPNVVLFRYIFHTSFIDPKNLSVIINAKELDAVHLTLKILINQMI